MSDQGPGFTVDLDAVRSFATDLQSDLDGHLSPENDHILRTFVDTPIFGARTASPEIQRAAERYREQLVQLLDLMDAFVYNGAVLARAAALVADAYESADIRSADDLLRTLSTAQGQTADATRTTQHDPKTGRAA